MALTVEHLSVYCKMLVIGIWHIFKITYLNYFWVKKLIKGTITWIKSVYPRGQINKILEKVWKKMHFCVWLLITDVDEVSTVFLDSNFKVLKWAVESQFSSRNWSIKTHAHPFWIMNNPDFSQSSIQVKTRFIYMEWRRIKKVPLLRSKLSLAGELVNRE